MNMKKTVLVVDDEENICITFTTFLEEEGYKVITADSYTSALQIIAHAPADIILSDILLGDKTGIDLLRELKSRGLRCPVIMITGAPNIETAAEALRLGAFDYIPKPFNKQTLLRVVYQALRYKNLDDQRENNHRHLEAIFKSVQDAIITVSPQQIITQANQSAAQLFNLPQDEIVGKHAAAAIPAALHPCLEVLEKTLRDRQPVREFRCEWRSGDKTTDVCILNSWPLNDSDGSFMGVVLTLRDVSRLVNLERELKQRRGCHRLVGASRSMQDIYALIDKLSEIEITVLITGQSGTGKELVAEAIHYNGSRALKPLIKVNCAALAENLLESELFGHVAGSFTGAAKDKIGRFQMADGGTIFLDEIGEISPALQLKLLRVLQEKQFERVGDSKPVKVDVRLISATNSNLPSKIERGLFRQDLYYRLNVLEIEIPPLTKRLDDIALLVDFFRTELNTKMRKKIMGVSDQVMDIFMNYSWPGNVRELEHVMERAFVFCHQDIITTEHLPPHMQHITAESAPAVRNDKVRSQGYEIILAALEKARWNRTRAADLLGMSRQTLYRKMKEYNFDAHID